MKSSAAMVLLRYFLAWTWTLLIASMTCVLCLLIGPTRSWVLVRTLWAKVTLALVGVRLNVQGGANLKGPAIFIANHQSLIDVVFLPAIVPSRTRFVAKRELLWVPIWGWAFGAGGALFIDRKNPRAAMRSLEAACKRLEAGWSIVVFPEGTRSQDGELGRFKRGAFLLASATGLPIVPIGFDGAREVVANGSSLVRGGDVAVHVGAPIVTTHWDRHDLRPRILEGMAAVAACVAQARQARAAARGTGPANGPRQTAACQG